MDDARTVLGAGWVEVPARGRGPGVIVTSGAETSGDALREACRRLADHGCVAWAPPSDRNADPVSPDQAVERLLCLEAVEGPRLGALSLGSVDAVALAAVSARIAAAVCLEPGGEMPRIEPQGVEARVLIVCAEKDGAVRDDGLSALRETLDAAGGRVELRVLPGVEPGFLDAARADRYDARTARVAWDAALAVLRAEL